MSRLKPAIELLELIAIFLMVFTVIIGGGLGLFAAIGALVS
jgi:hypothetical protein